MSDIFPFSERNRPVRSQNLNNLSVPKGVHIGLVQNVQKSGNISQLICKLVKTYQRLKNC